MVRLVALKLQTGAVVKTAGTEAGTLAPGKVTQPVPAAMVAVGAATVKPAGKVTVMVAPVAALDIAVVVLAAPDCAVPTVRAQEPAVLATVPVIVQV